MSNNKRPVLEEVDDDDIDNMDMNIAEFDPSLTTPIAPKTRANSSTFSRFRTIIISKHSFESSATSTETSI